MSERERIMQVMAQKGFTASQFAEAIGIQRAAMSHITSGRNNPSLDVMKKILERFPDEARFTAGSYAAGINATPSGPQPLCRPSPCSDTYRIVGGLYA